MTTDHADVQLAPTDRYLARSYLPRPESHGTAGVLTAGAMVALLSGDVRLAVRATRLMIDDGKQSSHQGSQATQPRATRLRRVWRRR